MRCSALPWLPWFGACCRGVFRVQEVGALAIDGVCPACHPLRVVLELPGEADTEVLWSVPV